MYSRMAFLLLLSTFAYAFRFKFSIYFMISIFFLALAAIVFFNNDIHILILISYVAFALAMTILTIREGQIRLVGFMSLGKVILSALSFTTSFTFDNILEPHQQDRLNVWLHPERCDPRGNLYNVVLSKMAISSGGVDGKGYMK